jgi:hypothetical protein
MLIGRTQPESLLGIIWVNDEVDGYSKAPGESDVQDSLDPSQNPPNCQLSQPNQSSPPPQGSITCYRDLENLARLWIDMKGTVDALNAPFSDPKNPPTSYLQIGLKWQPGYTGTPVSAAS